MTEVTTTDESMLTSTSTSIDMTVLTPSMPKKVKHNKKQETTEDILPIR